MYNCLKYIRSSMGRGDKKTKRGKISIGSFGNSRRRRAIKARIKRAAVVIKPEVAPVVVEEKPKAKKTTRKKEKAE